MTIAETRIALVSFTCDGCDCGSCVGDAMREIHQIPAVDHVRTDRRQSQIVVRHDPDGVTPEALHEVVRARGIELTD